MCMCGHVSRDQYSTDESTKCVLGIGTKQQHTCPLDEQPMLHHLSTLSMSLSDQVLNYSARLPGERPKDLPSPASPVLGLQLCTVVL